DAVAGAGGAHGRGRRRRRVVGLPPRQESIGAGPWSLINDRAAQVEAAFTTIVVHRLDIVGDRGDRGVGYERGCTGGGVDGEGGAGGTRRPLELPLELLWLEVGEEALRLAGVE